MTYVLKYHAPSSADDHPAKIAGLVHSDSVRKRGVVPKRFLAGDHQSGLPCEIGLSDPFVYAFEEIIVVMHEMQNWVVVPMMGLMRLALRMVISRGHVATFIAQVHGLTG
jgi:hypothetical protein